MLSEFGSVQNIRFLTALPKTERDEEWIYVLDELPSEGEQVICYGNKTICCDLDMEEAAEHTVVYHKRMSEWKEDKDGNKYDIKYYHDFDLGLDEEPCCLIFVSRWKKIKSGSSSSGQDTRFSTL